MNATITDLRTPAALLDAADRDEPVILTRHGEPRYELRKIKTTVDWDALESGKDDWLTADEAEELEKAMKRSSKILTHDTVP